MSVSRRSIRGAGKRAGVGGCVGGETTLVHVHKRTITLEHVFDLQVQLRQVEGLDTLHKLQPTCQVSATLIMPFRIAQRRRTH